nr:hypothetical protein Iba_chr06eCG9020 [Ipomoea batatas]
MVLAGHHGRAKRGLPGASADRVSIGFGAGWAPWSSEAGTTGCECRSSFSSPLFVMSTVLFSTLCGFPPLSL